MQGKIEDIKNIQNILWATFKVFYERDHNVEQYCNKVNDLVSEYDSELQWFCKNIVISWKSMIDSFAEDFRYGRDTAEKFYCVNHIQNTLWRIYKEFLADHKVKAYTDKAAALVHEYDGKKDMMLFAQTLILSWTPIINGLAEEFRNGTGG